VSISATAAKPHLITVPGHPLRARDPIESRTFARDLLWADYFDIDAKFQSVWLASRAHARRDLLWYCRNVLGLTRLSESIHRPPADFCMSVITASRYGFGNLRDPRGNGKTSLSTRGGSTWATIQDPIECLERNWPILGKESRIGINTLKSEFTAMFMQMIIDDLESSDFRTLFPDVIPEVPKRWGQKGVDLSRGLPLNLRSHPLFSPYPKMTRFLDPTFAPGSLESGRAGAHTHGEFIDDPVNEKTWNSEANITTAIHGIDQLFNVVRPERGFRLVTGNDWCPGDVNDRLDAKGVWKVFQRSATACSTCRDGYPTDSKGLVPKDAQGRPEHKHLDSTFTWLMPESDGSTPDLGRIREACGSIHIYMAQYENDPISPETTAWAVDRLPIYEVVEFRGSSVLDLNTLIKFPDPRARRDSNLPDFQVCRIRDLDRTLAFDPKHGGIGEGVSEGAITVLGRTPVDTFVWLSSIASQDDPLSMLGILIDEVIKWKVARIAVESVGYQRVIAPLLLREFEARKINWLNWEQDIVSIPTSRADGEKIERIRDSLNPLINTGALLVSPHMPGYHAAMLQLAGFPIRKPWDTLDSLSMHLHIMGVVPLALSERRRLRIQELLASRDRKRNMAVSWGWGRRRS
jgi:hypothetical protein